MVGDTQTDGGLLVGGTLKFREDHVEALHEGHFVTFEGGNLIFIVGLSLSDLPIVLQISIHISAEGQGALSCGVIV